MCKGTDILLRKILMCYLLVFVSCTNILTPVITKGEADKGNPGESALDMISAAKYTRLAVEVQFAPGMKPQDRSVNNLVGFLKTYTNKPGGITVTLKQVASIQKTKITTQDADSFAIKNRVLYTAGDLLTLYIYFADAISAKSWIGAVAYRNTSMIVFEKTIQDNTKGSGPSALIKMETGVMEHEVSHLLGLVNNGTKMVLPHEDAKHRFHCHNPKCLMYHAMESGALINLIDNAMPVLDADCIHDLQAARSIE